MSIRTLICHRDKAQIRQSRLPACVADRLNAYLMRDIGVDPGRIMWSEPGASLMLDTEQSHGSAPQRPALGMGPAGGILIMGKLK